MYILSYTIEDKQHSIVDWADHYELFHKKEDAEHAASVILEDKSVVMWAISKVLSASEPHWVVNLFEGE